MTRSFKSAVTRRITILRGTQGVPVWQRNCYEQIIRNEMDLNKIRQYILENPVKGKDLGDPGRLNAGESPPL